MSFPPPVAIPFRLSGFAAMLVLIALTTVPSGPAHADPSAGGLASGTTAPRASRSAGSDEWAWPVGPSHLIVNPYLAPSTRYSAGHRGIDLAAGAGAPVVAPADGTVHFAGVVVNRPVLSIRHPGGLISSFEPVTTDLREGATVTRGAVVGAVAAGAAGGGHCETGCVHFGVRLHGEYVSPLNYLGGIPASVLLPTR